VRALDAELRATGFSHRDHRTQVALEHLAAQPSRSMIMALAGDGTG
jgi:hypothetical protein